MDNSIQRIRQPGSWLLAISIILISALTSCASMKDDENPELVERSGARAKIVVDENAFSSSGSSYGYTVTGPDGRKTTVSIDANGWSWNAREAAKLEQYFTEALVQTGAFAVIDRTVIGAKRANAVDAEFLETDDRPESKIMRPDLKLRCTITELNPNAEVMTSNFFARGWSWLSGRFRYLYYASVGGGASKMSRKATCEIKVSIVDLASGEVIAAATGRGFSVGTASRSRTSGWGIGGGLGLGSSESKDANISVAIERATIRVVNDLFEHIPASYFRHER